MCCSANAVVYLSISLSFCLSIYLSIYLSICLPASFKTKLICDTSSIFELDNMHNEKFCETSSILELDTIQNEAILRLPQFSELTSIKKRKSLRDFLQKSWNVECRADGLVQMRFANFPLHLSKVLRLPRKSDAGSYEVLHLSHKIISANLKI